MKDYNFQVEFNELDTPIIKGVQHYYISGVIADNSEDQVHDILLSPALDDIYNQIDTITGDGYYDSKGQWINHSSWRDENTPGEIRQKPLTNQLPIVKVVDKERVKTSTANEVRIKAELNQNHPQFKQILKNVQDGFLHSFSVGIYPLQLVKKKIGGILKSFISKVSINNFTLTGNPINKNCTFSATLKAATEDAIEQEESIMDETKLEAFKSEVMLEVTKTIKSEVASILKANEDEKKKLVDETAKIKADNDSATEEKNKATLKAQEELTAKIKSLEETNKTVNDKLKSYDELFTKLKDSPILKAVNEKNKPTAEDKKEDITGINLFSMI